MSLFSNHDAINFGKQKKIEGHAKEEKNSTIHVTS